MMTHSNFMVYAGVHFKTCPIELREAWSKILNATAVKESIDKILEKEFKQEYPIEFVNIGTCNRFDLCLFGSLNKQIIYEIFYHLAADYFALHKMQQYINCPEKMADFVQIYFDAQALQKLFKVTASLDSLVLGEQQILGQIKDSYNKCVQLGFAKKTARQVFNSNFRVAKKIRTETNIGKNAVSIGTAVLEMTKKVFDNLTNKKVLIFGAGQMAKLVIKNLLDAGANSITIANRTIEKAEKLIREFRENTFALSLKDALSNIHTYDLCIIAIGGSNFLITKDILKNYERRRQGELSVFIDISVPRKITPEANEIDNIFLFYVDDLDAVMESNRLLRKKAAQEAEKIIESEVNTFVALLEEKNNLNHIGKMHTWITNIVNYELNRFFYDKSRGKNPPPKVIANAIAKKIISYPASLARTGTKIENNIAGNLLDQLFNLSEQEKLEFKKTIQEKNVIPLIDHLSILKKKI